MTRRLVRRAAAGGLVAAALAAMAAAVPAHAALPGINGNITYHFNDTFTLSSDGTSHRILDSNAGPGQWSPDGSRYAYVNYAASPRGIYTVRDDGSAPVRVTSGYSDADATWSPDGSLIFYDRDNVIRFTGSDGGWWQGDLGENPDPNTYKDRWPTVSVNNDIVYSRFHYDSATNTMHHWLMRFDPSDPHNLTPLIDDADQPDFSPDGTKIVYVSTVDNQIWKANADGTNPVQLTHESGSVSQPVWSPDGTTVLYVAGATGAPAPLKTVDTAGNVTPFTVEGDWVAWQPVNQNAVDRVWGQNAIGTGIAASQWNYADHGATDPYRSPAKAVVLSRSDAFYDALVGSALAINKQAPLLITPPSALDSGVEAEIKRVLGTSGDVYLLGGSAALSSNVEDRLKTLGYTTHRLAGANVFDTAIAIDKEILQGATPSIAVVATGMDYYDALAAGAAAGANPGTVIVLTNGDTMPTVSGNYLNTLNPDPNASNGTLIVTAGGPGDAALDEGFRAALMPTWPTTYQYNYVALNGANAMDTALLVAQFFFAAPQFAAVATFDGWYDALTGGAMIGAVGGPLLLTQPSGLYGPVADYLSQDAGGLWDTVILGGTAALPDDLVAPLGEAISLPGEWQYNDYLATLGMTSTSRTLASPNRVYGPKLTRSTAPTRVRH